MRNGITTARGGSGLIWVVEAAAFDGLFLLSLGSKQEVPKMGRKDRKEWLVGCCFPPLFPFGVSVEEFNASFDKRDDEIILASQI